MERRSPTLGMSFGLLILRVAIGGLLITHGLGKLDQVRAGKFDGFPDPIGLGSKNSLILTTVAEVGCAGLVIAGFLTRLAAIGPIVAMGVAAFVVHQADALAKKELALLYLAGYLAVLFAGPGRISIDGLLWRPKPPPPAAK